LIRGVFDAYIEEDVDLLLEGAALKDSRALHELVQAKTRSHHGRINRGVENLVKNFPCFKPKEREDVPELIEGHAFFAHAIKELSLGVQRRVPQVLGCEKLA
jgi:hypothetical protein